MITVTDLYVYPIKSCAGTRLDAAEVTATGLADDRLLMLTRPSGHFVSQREFPSLCLVEPRMEQGALIVNAPGSPEIRFTPHREGEAIQANIWGDRAQAVVQSAEVNQWFTNYLGADVQLVAMHQDHSRLVDREFATPNDVVGFADGFSMLLISEASLESLNSKLDVPVSMNRFRPNVVVTGCDPHGEDRFSEFTIGDVPMSGVKPCARCSVVAVEQSTGERRTQPTAVLAGYRRFVNGVMFGMNVVHHGTGRLAIGDVISVTSLHDADWVSRESFR